MRKTITVIVTLVMSYVVSGGPLVAQDATPGADGWVTPDPSECTVEPRSMESILAISATNDEGTPLAEPPAPAIATPGLQLPEGEPADQETVEAVTATIRQLVACENAGDLRRAHALYTDNVLIVFQTNEPLTDQQRIDLYGATPVARPPEAFTSIRISDVLVLPDGDVVAVTERRIPVGIFTMAYVLVQEGDGYLIDRVADTVREPIGTPPA